MNQQQDEIWSFLPGLLRAVLNRTLNLKASSNGNFLALFEGTTRTLSLFTHRQSGSSTPALQAPWHYTIGLGYDPAWLYGFMVLLVLCMVAQLVDPEASAGRVEGQDSQAGSTLEVCEEALATVFTPVEGCHPKDYKPALKSLSNLTVYRGGKGTADLVLDFESTWKALATGSVELRDDEVLEELFGACSFQGHAEGLREAGVRAFGRRIVFGFGRKWKAGAILKVLSAAGARLRESLWWRCLWNKRAHVGWESIPNLDTCFIEDTLDLDFIPIPWVTSALDAALRRQFALSGADLDRPYDDLVVEFTSLGPDVGFMSQGFFMCCAILLPRLGHNVSKSKKTALPFFVSVENVVKKLKSVSLRHQQRACSAAGTRNEIVVKEVKDISMLHAEALDLHESDMVFDKWIRSSFVARHGPDAWRETRLRLKWEAALLRAKVLVRSKITVTMGVSAGK